MNLTSGSTPMMIEGASMDASFFFIFVIALILLLCAMLYVTKKY